MIYLIGAISVISLALNFLIYRKIIASDALITFEELDEKPVEPDETATEVEEPSSPVVTVAMVEEVYQGWVNRRNIPLHEGATPLAPAQSKPETPGPLARPHGFV